MAHDAFVAHAGVSKRTPQGRASDTAALLNRLMSYRDVPETMKATCTQSAIGPVPDALRENSNTHNFCADTMMSVRLR